MPSKRSKPKYTRVHRLLRILALVESGSGWTPARLARECAVTSRTIHRDLIELAGAGFPVHFDQAAGEYRVASDVFLPPVQLTIDEALALAVLCEQIARREQIPFTDGAWRALAKVQASLPAALRTEITSLTRAIVVQTARAMPPDGFRSVYAAVQTAIATRRALVCRYESLQNAGPHEEFDFEPYALYFAVRAWYAVGYHSGRDAVRTLKLSRFARADLTSRAFSPPADFTLESYLGNAWRMIPGRPDHNVELRFDAAFADTVSDTLWHRTQQVDFHADGSATFRCTVSGLDEIVWWVLSMGPHCAVITPEELRQRVRRLAADVVSAYESRADTPPATRTPSPR